MRRTALAGALCAAAAATAALAWQQAPTPAQQQPPQTVAVTNNAKSKSDLLPLTRVVLFTSGVAYFEREGEVEGNVQVDLSFHVQDVNDLLKSLVVQDQGGGRISAVAYDSHDPVDRTLKSFAVDLTGNPGLGQLLNQARGEKVEVDWQGQTLKGSLVGVEHQKQVAGKDAIVEVEMLNLLTADGLRGLPLAQVQRVRFVNPNLDAELRAALEVLARSHDTQKRTVTFTFAGEGKRTVRVGYVQENPIWKTTYRLLLGADKQPFLQGWAIVDNVSDEDWKDVRVTLVAGHPISFRMDLYQPLYVPRPLVELELFAGLRPPAYGGALDGRAEAKAAEQMRKLQDKAAYGKGIAAPGADARFDPRQGVAPGVATQQVGESFQYVIKQPVSVPRQKSTLVPLLNQTVEGSRVSIYNAAVLAKHPLLGLKLKNATGLHLMQGPLTVLDGGSYAGDARIGDLQPGEERLLSFAVDTAVEVDAAAGSAPQQLTAVKVVKGVLYATHKLRQTKTYHVKNRSDAARTVLIEHPLRPDWALAVPKDPAERSRDVYRFSLTVPAGQTATQEVAEEQPQVTQVVLTTADDSTIRLYLSSTVIGPKVKEALEKAVALKVKLADTLRAIGTAEKEIDTLVKDQARLRANMERVPPTSETYQRYLKKLDEQETRIDQLQEQIRTLRKTEEEQRKAYESFLLSLDVG